MRVNLSKWLAGGIAFLLPLFFVLPPYALTFEAQISTSKLWLCVVAGGIAYSVFLCRNIHFIFGLINLCVLFGTVTVTNGDLNMNLWPYFYWLSATFVAYWFLGQSVEVKELTVKCLMWAACASSVLAFFQMFDLDPIMQYAPTITPDDRIRPIGMLGQSTKFAAFLAMMLPIAIVYRDYVSIFCISVALVATKSSFGYAAGVAGVLVVLIDLVGRSRIAYTVIAGVVGMYASYYFRWFEQMFQDNGRYATWEATITAWTTHQLWFGFGAGSFANLYHKAFQPWKDGGLFLQAHNDYIQWLFEFGVVGGVIMLLGLILVANHYLFFWWFRFQRQPGEEKLMLALQGTFAAILVNAIGNFPFQLAPHYLIAVCASAYLLKNPDNRVD